MRGRRAASDRTRLCRCVAGAALVLVLCSAGPSFPGEGPVDPDAGKRRAPSLLWSIPTGGAPKRIVPAGDVVVSGSRKLISGLDMELGAPTWNAVPTEGKDEYFAALTASPKAVYVLASDATLRVLSIRTGRELYRATVWPDPLAPAGPADLVLAGGRIFTLTDRGIVVLNETATRVIWRQSFDPATDRPESRLIISASAVGVISGFAPESGVEQPELILFDRKTGGRMVRTPVARPGRVVMSALASPETPHVWLFGGQTFWKIDPGDGKLLMTGSFPAEPPGQLALVRWMQETDRQLLVFFEVRRKVRSEQAFIHVLKRAGQKLVAIDKTTGRPLWTVTHEGAETVYWVPPFLDGDGVYVALGNGVHCLDASDGSLRARFTTSGSPVSQPVLTGQFLVVATASGIECHRALPAPKSSP